MSVTDKTDLVELATVLTGAGAHLLASSGTHKHLQEQGFDAEEIATYTGSPELLGGRVKTLHPKIHAGILADRADAGHMTSLDEHAIRPIDIVVVNLYPFREKRLQEGISERELVEFIDIGGITLIRAAAKNFHSVAVVTDPSQYELVIEEIRLTGTTSLDTRARLARDAFRLTTSYDTAIESFFSNRAPEDQLPQAIPFSLERVQALRYGENPHQRAALYRTHEDSFLMSFVQHQGKELSFNNYLDIVGAFLLARDLEKECVAIIKHTNPCGAAWTGSVPHSYERALECDPISAFGGIVAAHGTIDIDAANAMSNHFLEVIIASSFTDAALEKFSKKKNLRVLTIPERFWSACPSGPLALLVENALLYQEMDSGFPELDEMQIVTGKHPSPSERDACAMAWKVAKHVKSNAIVIGNESGTIGIGAGQMSRVDSAKIAVEKAQNAGLTLNGAVAASDAYFPFPDGVLTLAHNGITAVIQPGGSIRDKEVIAAANNVGIAMIFTGRRHFRHL